MNDSDFFYQSYFAMLAKLSTALGINMLSTFLAMQWCIKIQFEKDFTDKSKQPSSQIISVEREQFVGLYGFLIFGKYLASNTI